MNVIKKNIYRVITGLCLIALAHSYTAQGFYNKSLWKKHRHEFNFHLGASNFLGELGGRDMIGTDFIMDLELSKTKLVGGASYMYYLGRQIGWRTNLFVGQVAGDDALTAESFRNNRNLSFQSIIAEASTGLEIQFIKEKVGNLYNLRSKTGKKLGAKGLTIGLYGTIGIGAFYFNPKSTGPDGQLVALHDLNTEGQGLPNGPEDYKRIGIAIPVGLGFRKSFGRTSGIKVELTHRFTFTDYIDDVSTVYYNSTALSANYGALSSYFGNPQLGNKPNYVTAAGQQRGDSSDNDGYMFLTVSYYIKLQSKSRFYGRNKVRRVKASF